MRQHVSREEITALERGELVRLNHYQLAELRRFAPAWVRVTSVAADALGRFFNVAIDDTRATSVTGMITRARDTAAKGDTDIIS